MFRRIVFILLCSIVAFVSETQAATTSSIPTSNEIRQQYAATLAKSAKNQEETHAMNLKLIARTEALLTRQENDMARFEKILETWERQQVQYQKYLDSLNKK